MATTIQISRKTRRDMGSDLTMLGLTVGDQVTQTDAYFTAHPKSPARIGLILGFPEGKFVRIKWTWLMTPQTLARHFVIRIRVQRTST
jgi:hypothetical protein